MNSSTGKIEGFPWGFPIVNLFIVSKHLIVIIICILGHIWLKSSHYYYCIEPKSGLHEKAIMTWIITFFKCVR